MEPLGLSDLNSLTGALGGGAGVVHSYINTYNKEPSNPKGTLQYCTFHRLTPEGPI